MAIEVARDGLLRLRNCLIYYILLLVVVIIKFKIKMSDIGNIFYSKKSVKREFGMNNKIIAYGYDCSMKRSESK